MQQIPLKCHRDGCWLTWATIVNGVLMVESRHDGHRHHNAISLDVLLQLMLASRYTSEARLKQIVETMGYTVEPQTEES